MIDVLTYTDNLPEFRQWLAANASLWPKNIGRDDNGVWVLNNTPTKSSGNHSVSLVRVENMDFINASPLEVLSQVPVGENAFALDAIAQAKLDLAHPRPIINIPERTFMGSTTPASTCQDAAEWGFA